MGLAFPSYILDNASKSRWRGNGAPITVYQSCVQATTDMPAWRIALTRGSLYVPTEAASWSSVEIS
jgi:hypothetical protein